MGVFASMAPCRKCGGTGRLIHQPCPNCRGTGAVRKRKTIKVNIPAGIDHGQTISLRGQGNAGKNGGPPATCSSPLWCSPTSYSTGTAWMCSAEAPITFAQAVLGAELEIPTIDGKVKYSIPEGTQTGTVFRLKGKGIPVLNGRGRGDQYVTVTIETPRNLNKEQKEALRRFSETLGESNYEKRKSFFQEKVRPIHVYSRLPIQHLFPDGKMTMSQAAEAALRAGLDEICITDHVDTIFWGNNAPRDSFDWASLRAQYREALEKYGDKLSIKLGAELGEAYLGYDRAEILLNGAEKLDFCIGSVHTCE